MKFRYYRALKAIVDEGTVSAAARRLNVSQPALSLTIKQFEDRLQYKLFRREKKRLIPTDEALKLISASDEVFDAVDRLDRVARSLQTGGRETLRIGVVQALAFEVVPSAIGAQLKQTDENTFHIQTGAQSEMSRQLKSGLLDAIVIFGGNVDPALCGHLIGECRGVVVTKKERVSAHDGKKLDLSTLTLVDVLGSGPFGRFITEQLLLTSKRQSACVATETLYAALPFVKKNGFAAVLDEFTAHMGGSEIEVRILKDLDPFPISLVTRETEKTKDVYITLKRELENAIQRIQKSWSASREVSFK